MPRRSFHVLYDVRCELAEVYDALKRETLDPRRGNAMIRALSEIAALIEQERVERRMSVLDQKIAVLRQLLGGTPLEQLPEWARLPVIQGGAIEVREQPDVLDG
jgi:hypothetical protein